MQEMQTGAVAAGAVAGAGETANSSNHISMKSDASEGRLLPIQRFVRGRPLAACQTGEVEPSPGLAREHRYGVRKQGAFPLSTSLIRYLLMSGPVHQQTLASGPTIASIHACWTERARGADDDARGLFTQRVSYH